MQPFNSKIELSPAEIERYSRHFSLPQVGIEGQKKLKATRVLCVGVGGLGSPLTLYLAAAGIGTIGIIDPDRVESSNLQRQVIYTDNTIGQPKVEAAKAKLLQLNPFIQIETFQEALTETNALSVIEQYDIIVDGTDNFPTRFLVNDACCYLKKPNVYASVFQFEGQLSVFCTNQGPCYRCLYPEAPPAHLIPNCAEGGVLGVLPGIMGSLQALEVIKLALGIGAPLIGKLLAFDALQMAFREFEIQKNPHCDSCSKPIDFKNLKRPQASCDPFNTSIDNVISVYELQSLRAENKNFTLVDVREPFEYEICNLGGQLIPLGELPKQLHTLDKSQLIVVHCKLGVRGKKALELLQAQGFKQVKNLEGGILRWIEKIDASLSKY